jgi:multiple sugar transport system permease protein
VLFANGGVVTSLYRAAVKTVTQSSGLHRIWSGSSLRRREAIAGYIAILPWFLGFLIFSVGPIIASLGLTFTRWEMLSPLTWAGLANYRRLVTDPLVKQALWNTAFYTLLSVPLNLAAALFAAIVLNVGVKGTNLYRTIIYLPSQMPAVATSILWFFIFSPVYGLANEVLRWFGIPPQRWLWDVQLVKPSLVIMRAWAIGTPMVIFLAGLQAIPVTLYEAAKIDGASIWRQFLHITLPMLSPTIFFNLVMGVIGSFQVFTSVLIMTNGGPGNSSLMMVLYIYRNGFQYFNMGYAAVLSWVLFAIVLVLTFIQFRISGRWVHYEAKTT